MEKCNKLLLQIEPQTPQERAKAKRLYKAYRWTWAMYQALGAKQGWKCAICGRSAKNAPLQVDHRHFHLDIRRLSHSSVEYLLEGLRWVGTVREMPDIHPLYGTTKEQVKQNLYEIALPRSVRGLLCPGRHFGCNRLLGRVDNPDWLEKARNYLLDPPAKSVL